MLETQLTIQISRMLIWLVILREDKQLMKIIINHHFKVLKTLTHTSSLDLKSHTIQLQVTI